MEKIAIKHRNGNIIGYVTREQAEELYKIAGIKDIAKGGLGAVRAARAKFVKPPQGPIQYTPSQKAVSGAGQRPIQRVKKVKGPQTPQEKMIAEMDAKGFTDTYGTRAKKVIDPTTKRVVKSKYLK